MVLDGSLVTVSQFHKNKLKKVISYCLSIAKIGLKKTFLSKFLTINMLVLIGKYKLKTILIISTQVRKIYNRPKFTSINASSM